MVRNPDEFRTARGDAVHGEGDQPYVLYFDHPGWRCWAPRERHLRPGDGALGFYAAGPGAGGHRQTFAYPFVH